MIKPMHLIAGFGLMASGAKKKDRPHAGAGAALTRWKRKNRKKPPHMRGRA